MYESPSAGDISREERTGPGVPVDDGGVFRAGKADQSSFGGGANAPGVAFAPPEIAIAERVGLDGEDRRGGATK